MFINKFSAQSSIRPQKMSSYINVFLKTEITCIPKLLNNYLGDYYNNALCNGATWVFALWCFLHIIFDKCINAFLKKLRYREYVRSRLKNSLWYLGFYGTSLVYCGAALAQNEVELFNFKNMHVPSSTRLPTKVMMGYTIISTFYLHSALWEGLSKGSLTRMLNFFFLFAFLVSSYILRVVEISFTLTGLIGIAQASVEFTRCCFMSSDQDSFLSKFVVGSFYLIMFAVYLAIHIVVIPLTFVVPLGLKILSDYPNILLVFLFCNLGLWLLTEIYQSVLFKLVDHWLYHEDDTDKGGLRKCTTGILECSLFNPRDDVSYNLQIVRQEIKDRKSKMMSLRKPKNRGMLIQTLKCMVALKRKLNEKRLSDSSDSDESERSGDSELKSEENTDNDAGELLSEQDDDSESQASVIENKTFNKTKKSEDSAAEEGNLKPCISDKDNNNESNVHEVISEPESEKTGAKCEIESRGESTATSISIGGDAPYTSNENSNSQNKGGILEQSDLDKEDITESGSPFDKKKTEGCAAGGRNLNDYKPCACNKANNELNVHKVCWEPESKKAGAKCDIDSEEPTAAVTIGGDTPQTYNKNTDLQNKDLISQQSDLDNKDITDSGKPE